MAVSNILFILHPYTGKWSNVTFAYFSTGWWKTHQLGEDELPSQKSVSQMIVSRCFFGRMRNDSTSWRFEGRVLKCHVGNLFLGLQDVAKWLETPNGHTWNSNHQFWLQEDGQIKFSKNIIKCKSGMFNNLMCQKFWAPYLNDHYLMPLRICPPPTKNNWTSGSIKHEPRDEC